MSHDIDDLLNLIKQLEERIIQLELARDSPILVTDDSYYWEHG